MGLIQDIQQPDFETRLAILQKKHNKSITVLIKKLLTSLLNSLTATLENLKECLAKFVFYASLMGQKNATLEMLTKVKRQHCSHKQTLTSDSIMEQCASIFSVDKDDIVGKRKTRKLLNPAKLQCI
jgi:chromosomal replication initiator protein